jgi:hypothetical protein
MRSSRRTINLLLIFWAVKVVICGCDGIISVFFSEVWVICSCMKLKKCTILRIVPIQRVAETDRRLDKRFEETDKAIKKLTTLFTGQWAGGN